MKHVKSFKLYENVNSEIKTFGHDEHLEFCQAVAEMAKGKEVRWCLYENPALRPESLKTSKRYWDMYVKGGVEASIVEKDGKLICFMHKDGEIVRGWGEKPMAFDNMDMPLRIEDLSSLEALI